MPSRRAILAGAVAGTAGLSGCLASAFERTGSVKRYVQQKTIKGWPRDGANETVLDVAYDDREERVTGYVSEQWSDYVDDPDQPTISEALHEELHQTYEHVWYSMGVCSEQWETGDSTGCQNDFTDRENFNQAQVHDRVKASYLEDKEHIEIHDVIGTKAKPSPE
ncbi:hypothetical protein SAMN06269185_1004 [Natronoarchaeum philippinense]|uniref:Uncharacterized protein n=1 Tax=Natronoarchaeum philippinense TaxID=558529 RepID=A0A285N9M8_NATPI|nr:hypothetical protein [Natronoarchaeum philippinense]SNZ05998.1 hypothetical protein SAMN06269185_1004 [Natronoarchaeum philippinense]